MKALSSPFALARASAAEVSALLVILPRAEIGGGLRRGQLIQIDRRLRCR
jgi:hypothetical protein